jgi:hypothetical protein
MLLHQLVALGLMQTRVYFAPRPVAIYQHQATQKYNCCITHPGSQPYFYPWQSAARHDYAEQQPEEKYSTWIGQGGDEQHRK